MVNAILYITHTGVQRRHMPHDLADWQFVYHELWKWKKDGTLKKIHDTLRGQVCKAAWQGEQPTAAILDSQSVKATEEAETRGDDAGKKEKGSKRHPLVNTVGLIYWYRQPQRMSKIGM